MSSRLPPFSFPPAPVSRLSRCFSTTADGRIPLTRDWPHLLATLARLPHLAWQTRHHAARLIALDRLPALSAPHPGAHRADARGHLEFDFERWHVAWARVALCPCCESAGRIEVLNARGAEFMHLCAHPASAPTDWAETVAALNEGRPADLPPPDFAGSARFVLPGMPARSAQLGAAASRLIDLLRTLGENGHTLSVLLRTVEVSHRRRFHPAQVALRGSVLHAWSRPTTWQLALDAVVGLALEQTTEGVWLHAAGADDTVLMSFGPGAATGPDRQAWDHAVQALFPI